MGARMVLYGHERNRDSPMDLLVPFIHLAVPAELCAHGVSAMGC